MGVVRLSVLTVIGVGAALAWFGRDDGLEDHRIGREDALFADVSDRVLNGGTESVPDTMTQSDTGKTEMNDSITVALRSDASPDTATRIRETPTPSPTSTSASTLAAAQKPAVETSTPEATPTPEPTPILYVTGSRVNVRGGPSTAFGVINALGYGSKVEDLGDASDGWREVRIVETGERGFMAGRFLADEAP